MPKAQTTTISGKLKLVSAQRQQYKPYLYELTFENVLVELDIPNEGIALKGPQITLNLEGFKAVLEQLSDAVDEVHDKFVIKSRKAGKF